MNSRKTAIKIFAIGICFVVGFLLFVVFLNFKFLYLEPDPTYYRVTIQNDSSQRVETIRLATWLEGSALNSKPAGENFYFEKSCGSLDPGQRIDIQIDSNQIGEGTLSLEARVGNKTVVKPVFEYVTQGFDDSATVQIGADAIVVTQAH